jgi:hypothetical protein
MFAKHPDRASLYGDAHRGQAGELLAEGAEALLEAAFRTGDYAIAQARLNQARDVVQDRATEAAIADWLGWLLHFQALDNDRDTSRVDEELALFQRALDIRRDLGDLGGVAAALFAWDLCTRYCAGTGPPPCHTTGRPSPGRTH